VLEQAADLHVVEHALVAAVQARPFVLLEPAYGLPAMWRGGRRG